MAKKNHTKKALISSLLALFICFTMLIGTTFAWFTDTAVSSGNRIQAGNLDIALKMLKGNDWVDASKGPIFDYDKWEPGYTDVKILKVENNGTLALKWQASISASAEFTELAKVIDVYVYPSEDTALSMPADRNLADYTKVGTLAEFAKTMETTTQGVLLPEGKTSSNPSAQPHEVVKEAYLGIALKMQEDAGNEYQGMSLIKTDDTADNGYFNINISATQYTYEEDSFNNQYDKDAEFATVVSNDKELDTALKDGKTNLLLMPGEYTADLYSIKERDSLTINGSGANTKLAFNDEQVRASQFKNLTINNCTIERMPDKGWGHLVFSTSATAGVYTISNCVFNGVGSQGIYINQTVPATFNIKNCTFNGDFGGEGAITIQNNDNVDFTVNVTDCEFKNIPNTSHEICMLYTYNGFTLNAPGVKDYWK